MRKITIVNSVRYIPQSEKKEERKIKPKTIVAGSLPREQNKNVSQNNEKVLKNVSTGGFVTLTK